jgi:hypothetical protein
MAEWKKVVVSGSQAELAGITASALGVFAPQSTEFNVVVANATGELKTTGSDALAGSSQTLSAGEGIVITNNEISASLASDGGLTFNGSDEIAISSSVGTLTGNSFTGSFTGSFAGDGSDLTNITASELENDLTNTAGGGLGTFTFNGSSAVDISVSGAAFLTDNTIVKWNDTDGKFVDSAITNDTNALTLGKTDGSTVVTVPGDLIVNGTASFQNTQTLFVEDRYILLNSGSTSGNQGGIVIQTENTQNVGQLFGYQDSSDRWGIDSAFSALSTADFTADAFMGLTSASANSTSPNVSSGTTSTMEHKGNVLVTNDEEIWIYA